MIFDDLLFKLLPFTTKQDETVAMVSWSQLLDSDKIITSVELFLIAIFLSAFMLFLFSFLQDRKKITQLNHILQKYKNIDMSAQYSHLMDDIRQSSKDIQVAWKEFDESLIKKRMGGNVIIRNPHDAQYFFNKATLTTHTGSKLLASVPGVLLGIGLLGTFFGLYVALVQLNIDVENAQTTATSIKFLIEMAGVKFAASIWGLFLSVIFTMIEKPAETFLDRELQSLQNTINKLFIKETAEQNLDQIMQQNKMQTAILSLLSEAISQKISQQFETILSQQITELSKTMTSSISKALDQPLKYMSDTVKEVTHTQAKQSKKALEEIINRFIDKIDTVAGNQREILQQSALESQKVLQETSNHLSETFHTVTHLMQEQKTMFETRDKKVLKDWEMITNQQAQTLEKVVSNIHENIETLSMSISTNLEHLLSTMTHIQQKQETLYSQREDSFVVKLQELIQQLEHYSQEQMLRENQKNESIHKMLEELEAKTKLVLNELKESVSYQVKFMNQSTFDMLTSFSKIGESLLTVPNHIERFNVSIQSLGGFEEGQKEVSEKLSRFGQSFDLSAQSIALSTKTLDEGIDSFMQASTQIKESMTNLDNTLIKIFETHLQASHKLDKKLGQFAQTMSEGFESLTSAVEKTKRKSSQK